MVRAGGAAGLSAPLHLNERTSTLFLRELHVENLGVIRSASLRLDASTTLIGESDCGRGSLFRALELVLRAGRDGASTPTASDLSIPGARPWRRSARAAAHAC